ncbi:uncharacterized protein L3040_007931 [Drepanopeziza brunnea f. sp. 'multigermtubi']|uniref:uncharacterized protein n=1 Tax=Drepanopeziza brunnea f. sp. 'multigermtubi' TaxID=698441 RepID=UPI00238B8FE1|nr:hypothetical protein L3040_007931 [Drepanopeziza brunnea f. sp. 'multigermtubi']
MEPEAASVPAAQWARMHAPESLRQRQRDRLAPRGRLGPPARIETTVREVDGLPKNGITLAPAPRSRLTGKRSLALAKKKQSEEGLRKENSLSRRAKREAEDARFEITPDGSSAGREGRQFTVAKVGNNGKIYLRPTIRPSNQRYPQPSFVFPITPPSTAGLDALVARSEAGDDSQYGSLWTSSRTPSMPAGPGSEQAKASRAPRRQRAQSASTVGDQHLPVLGSGAGAFKIVIERPATKPKAPEPPFGGIPTLEVSIPSHKLGTPRFSTRGTALIRGSSYTTTDAERSSGVSSQVLSLHRPSQTLSRRHSDASPQQLFSPTAPSIPLHRGPVCPPKLLRQGTAIVPEMFDTLTFKPACDHPSIVRYAVGGGIRAATPARLVAEITSPTFVDYDLLSDFFLSYRSFLDTTDLLHMLIARLRWALARDDEMGTVVRVRTFVAIRHWVLNYFLDDYVVDYDLRKSFCDLLNGFVDELLQDPSRTKVPLKMLAELKKCWRRVCALYWDGPEFEGEFDSHVPILPGGVAGSRNPALDPTFWQTRPEGPPRLDGIIQPDFAEQPNTAGGRRDFFADVSRAGHPPSVSDPPRDLHDPAQDSYESQPRRPPSSLLSEDFVSCSFPSRQRSGSARAVGAHPVPASSIYEPLPPVATTPKSLAGKRVRPVHAHKRSASFSDSYRDRRTTPQHERRLQQPVQKVIFKSTELLLALPYAGSIVRGNLFPPGQAFVDVIAPTTPAEVDRATTLFPDIPSEQKGPSAMSGPGMKRLLGSVRRALSSRTGGLGGIPSASPTQGSFPNIPPLGVRGATVNRLPGTAVVPQARSRDAALPMRIDLLGAEIAEDFKKAVREDAEAEAEAEAEAQAEAEAETEAKPEAEAAAEQRETDDRRSEGGGQYAGLQYSSMAPDTTDEQPEDRRELVSEMNARSNSYPNLENTTELSVMTGALARRLSADSPPDLYIHPSGGPTPPSTPPDVTLGTPRRTPHVPADHARPCSTSLEGTPSLVVDPRPSGEDERSPCHRPPGRLGMKDPKGLAYRTKRSGSLRRHASFHSGFERHRSECSFDAASFSEYEGPERVSHVSSALSPLRVLRRRPGGDLRAVSHVGDLDTQENRRPMSTGSLTAYSDSIRSSYLLGPGSSHYVDVVNSDYDHTDAHEQDHSLGALTELGPKSHVSLLSTLSSQPVMRPSFAKEAAMLAQIPDDDDDDGGVESALLKLEGKFEKRCSDVSRSLKPTPVGIDSFDRFPLDVSTLALEHEDAGEKRRHRQRHIVEPAPSESLPRPAPYRPQYRQFLEEVRPSVYQPEGCQPAPPLLSPRSVESYNSIPLLERELTGDSYVRENRRRSARSVLHGESTGGPHYDEHNPESSHVKSIGFMEETDSMRGIPAGESRDDVDRSLLDSEKGDLSSEISLESISEIGHTEQDSSTAQSFLPTKGTALSHPHRQPPSPPMTMLQALNLGPPSPLPQESYSTLPPTPEITPTGAFSVKESGVERGAFPATESLRSHRISEPSRKTSVHLPFVLAFDSQVLAQQFTLIEKDALNEIDWKDLIEMCWKDVSTESRSWVEFLRQQEPRGVEVVIARFNLMVKWAVSEIVLTQDLVERVRCIIKFIHIAAHCRSYRNFATMAQLTVALTSKEISRLVKTWAHVPAADKETLRHLELLVTPTQNFHSLRAEMEGAGAGQGCIPFVCIYTHDLLVNSERPSQIASTPTTEPLVNFEKCRTDATIVKNLLRLLEASSLYQFQPIEGITERCLWMAALTDEEITRYGKAIHE